MSPGGPVLVVTLTALAACSGSPVAPAPGRSQSTTAMSPAASSSTSGAAPGQPGRRTKADLRRALLTGGDLPAGLVVVPTQTSGATMSSADPRCATLVTIINTPTAIGSLLHVEERLVGGSRGPFVDEAIDELAGAAGVAAEQAQLKSALASCTTLTLTDPPQATSTITFESLPPPRGGQHPFALRARVVRGGEAGFEFIQVSAGVADTVVQLSFVNTSQAQIDQIVPAGVDQATRVLAGTP